MPPPAELQERGRDPDHQLQKDRVPVEEGALLHLVTHLISDYYNEHIGRSYMLIELNRILKHSG